MNKDIVLKIEDYQTREINGYLIKVYTYDSGGAFIELEVEELVKGCGAAWTRNGITTIQKEELGRIKEYLEKDYRVELKRGEVA